MFSLQDPMAGSQEESIMDLLRPYISDRADLPGIVEKLHSNGFTVPTLLELSEKELEDLISEVFPAATLGAIYGFKGAIRHRNRNSAQEGESPSKMVKRSPDEFVARSNYFKKLLEAPPVLPESVEELREFLSQKPVQLPLLDLGAGVNDSGLVKVYTSGAELTLAGFSSEALCIGDRTRSNEATSSARLWHLTGNFLSYLNHHAPADCALTGLYTLLDSPDVTGTSGLSALKPLKRPDCMLYVREALILRWENKIDASEMAIAKDENAKKLSVWSTLYYGTLPYVIGGCCGGGLFRWLKLSPDGKKIVVEPISECYDLKVPRGVALLLHSTIRMHCLLQKLQEKLTDFPPLKLYQPIARSGGGKVTVYPEFVVKEVPFLTDPQCEMLEKLYASIAGSRYLIQLDTSKGSKPFRKLRDFTIIRLAPVGDPNARPLVLKDLGSATHDMLHGLAELHGKGYTHRDLRWENCIKVNVRGEWKWVIIDLEAGGPDNEEWVGGRLRSWDARTLEERDGKGIYTKGSDMHQLGNLIVEWLDGKDGEEVQLMRALGKTMQQERRAAAEMLEDMCKNSCRRCGKFEQS